MPTVGSDVVIAGIGETPVGRLPGWSPVEIQAAAVLAALRDAGFALSDLDGLINLDPYATPNSMFSSTLAEHLGVAPRFACTVDVGGTVTGMTMLQQAVWAIESGYCEVAACVYGENALTGRPAGAQGLHMHNLLGGEEWEEPFGLHGMVIPYALLAQRYLDLYGATDADLAAVALVTRRHALLNDNAQMRKPMTLEDYRASRQISSPLRLLDCSLVSDGGGALVLTRIGRAPQGRGRGVAIRAIGMKTTHNSVALMPDIPELGMAAAGADAYEAAGMGPEDIQVANLHDAFTISVLVSLEALGFARPGEGGALVRSGAMDLGGRWPLNPHGGLLSQAHIGGMLHITEAVRQLRGEAGRRQVEGARRALVSGNGGIFSVCGAMILEKP
ncbi:Acetyl-CoA acetyltransferase [Azospirillum oryzae]|uniref:Acetyl-CoA acetyltransferase n=1 Tax=Azospirillum oryzae TaxID=286727 RepID=A0A1X7HKU2_9PROT|nr:thiolase family protein [Azospirillum oryzae]SMF88559.1 Acetyl-CoA acetyltransferase [Azospirillum oryzae]